MAVERDLELLDDYLANRLSGQDKAAFEAKLQADPSLKSEYQLQNHLIEGIRNARVAELKTMLGNVPVPAVGIEGSSLLIKAAAWCVVAGLIGSGFYFFLNRENKEETEQQSISETKTIEEKVNPVSPTVEEKKAESENEKPALTKREEKKLLKEMKKASKASASDKGDTKIAEKRKLEVFDPTRETETVNTKTIVDPSDSGSKASNTNMESTSILVVTDNTSKKYTFHYQWKNEKLILYGSFEKNLYEILEFFSENKRTAFLYYKDSYYLLSEEDQKVKELVPITDENLLTKLKTHRETK